MHYGTGAIMAVPAHDQRDFDFAKRYNLPIIEVIKPKETRSPKDFGSLINSGRFTGMKSEQAKERITEWLDKSGSAKKAVHYRLRDWIFSRQRYWGEPIPMIKCEKCGWQPVSEQDLPIKLPKINNYKPTEKGQSPLAKAKTWIKAACPKCGSAAQRETDVMPNWAGSNWYYLRYCDPQNDKRLANSKKIEHWMPVDWYNGGMEHVTLHLLYSRFIYKFLWDIKAVPRSIGSEPYKKRTAHGIILGQGGVKMSKSRGNVINPEKVVKEHGADTMRVYEMFMGPFEQMIPWDTKGIKGVRRFLEKVWEFQEKLGRKLSNGRELQELEHRTIKKTGEDMESLKFNTAISSLMIFVNRLGKEKEISLTHYSLLLILLSPFAPHISEELWERAGFKGLCSEQKWPKYNPKLIKERKITLVIQINGKVRDKIEVESDISEKEAKEIALSRDKVLKYTKGKKIKKTIFVPGKLINFVL